MKQFKIINRDGDVLTAKIVEWRNYFLVKIDGVMVESFSDYQSAKNWLCLHYEVPEKKLIGRLPVNCKYNVIDTSYKAKDAFDFCTCDNCGKIISNIAVIENEQKQRFNVGLDCAMTMSLYQNDAVFNIIEAKKELARRAKFTKWYLTKCQSVVDDNGLLWFFKTKTEKWTPDWIYRMKKEYFIKNYNLKKICITI